MNRALRIFNHDPLTIVEMILAVGFLVGGIYIMTPIIVLPAELASSSGAVQALASYVGLVILGIACVISATLNLIGIARYKYNLRSIGLFMQILIRIYVLVALILVQGFVPLDWLTPLIQTIIAFVCYIVVRRKINFFKVNNGR